MVMTHKNGLRQILRKNNNKMILVVLFFFVLTTFSINKSISVSANGLYNDNQILKIGLKSMISNAMTVKINGGYLVNSKLYNSGTSFKISNSSGKIFLDGVQVTSLSFISQTTGTTICITSGGISRSYVGDVLFKIDSNTSEILAVNSVKLEDYLKGVIPYEVSESYPIEALKAQAVAARSYALANMGNFNAYGYDLTDDISSQVYSSCSSNNVKCNQAVDITKGQIITNNGQVVSAYFSASDGGYTEDSGNVWSTCLPYFLSNPDSFDLNYNWVRSFTSAQIQTLIRNNKKILLTDTFKKINLSTITKYKSGRISNIEIDYEDIIKTAKSLKISKEAARTFLSLPSALYTVTYVESTDTYTFNGTGNGHGVGMSQTGAKNRAISGQTYYQILNFYYDNTVIENLVVNEHVGWILKDGKWYYSQSNGTMEINKWEQDSSKQWFYLGATGAMVTNTWAKDSSKQWFYLGCTGAMVTNSWAKDSSGRWFYLGPSGAMVINTWVSCNGYWYYLSADGSMVIGNKLIGGKWYYFNNGGDMS